MISRPQRAGSGRHPRYFAESLESRRLLSAYLAQPISNVRFAQDSGPESVDLYALFADSNGNADLSFTVTSSVPSIVSSSILGNNLTLTPAAGRSGYSIIKMVASDPTGGRVTNQFRIQITALPARSLDVTLDAKHRSVRFVQSDHSSATISLTGPGTAVVHFGGDGLKLSGASLQGSHVEMESVKLSNTTGASHLSIIGARSGSGQAVVGDIIIQKNLGSLDVHKATLLGDVRVAGALGNLNVDLAQTGGIGIGAGSTRMNVGTAADEVFSSAGSVSFLKATQWLDTDDVPESFSASAIKGMDVRGNFMPSVAVTGTGVKGHSLDNIKVRGAIKGNWNDAGSVGSLDVGGFFDGWQGRFGAVGSITVNGDFNQFVTAQSIGQFKVRGFILNALVVLTGTGRTGLGSLSAANIKNLQFYSPGSVGSITAETISGSKIFVGIANVSAGDVLPAVTTDFTPNVHLGSVRLRPHRFTGFIDTLLAAPTIGTLALVSTTTKNSGKVYGIAAESIDTLTMQDRSRGQTFALHKVKTAAALQSLITAHKWVLGDLSLRVI